MTLFCASAVAGAPGKVLGYVAGLVFIMQGLRQQSYVFCDLSMCVLKSCVIVFI